MVYLYNDRHNAVHRLLNDLEAVAVIATQHVVSHESEDGHDIMKDAVLRAREGSKGKGSGIRPPKSHTAHSTVYSPGTTWLQLPAGGRQRGAPECWSTHGHIELPVPH